MTKLRSTLISRSLAAAACASAVLLAGCDSPASDAPLMDDVASFRVAGDEVEPYQGFDGMLHSADLTVVGRVGEAHPLRTVGEEHGVAYLLPFDVRVETVLAGSAPEPLTVELTLGAPTLETAEAQRDEFGTLLEGQRVLLYLRHKGGAEEGLYRVVNSGGWWMATRDEAIAAPLAERGGMTFPEWRDDLEGFESFDDWVASVTAEASLG